jgi:hypothetical protein
LNIKPQDNKLVDSKQSVLSGKIKSKSGGNIKLNSAVENQQFLGIGHNAPDFSNPNPHIQRMQHVRSFRKSNGIVM